MNLFKTNIKYKKNLSYTQIIDLYCKEYNIKIKHYYKTLEGTAFLEKREIEIPYLIDDTSFIIAFHEISHILNADIFENLPPYKFEYWTEIWAMKEAKKWKVKSDSYLLGAKKYVKTYVDECIRNGINKKLIPKYILEFISI